MSARQLSWPVGLGLGIAGVVAARKGAAFSLAGDSVPRDLVLLAAGWGLLACGALSWRRRRDASFGPLLVAASAAWFLAELDNPEVGSALAFTLGLVLAAACAPLVGWAMLSYPDRRPQGLALAAVVVACASATVIMGLAPTLVNDTRSLGCNFCPDNLLLVRNEPDVLDALGRAGIWLGLVTTIGLIAAAGWELTRASYARRRLTLPVVACGSLYLGLVAATYAASLDRGFVGTGELEQRLWLGEGLSLVALALAVGLARWRSRQTRSTLARLVVDLGATASPGSLRAGVADLLGDPDLRLAYPLGDGRHVNADGQPVDVVPSPSQAVTPVVREGETIVTLVHRADALDDPDLLEEVAAAARLALENERLQAQTRAQLEDLRASRSRIVAAGDAERRRLERDLHDGAQQRLVGLSLLIRLAASRSDADSDSAVATRLADAERELQGAIAELREIAHGLHPAVLEDEGLAAAIESLAESGTLEVLDVPETRYARTVETAAYLLVAEASRNGPARVAIRCEAGRLVVDIATPAGLDDVVALEDRIGALDGTLVAVRQGGGVTIHAEIPCE